MADHDSISMLIPWYANGTLSPEERDGVEDHLEKCSECRALLEQARAMEPLGKLEPDELLDHVQAQHLELFATDRRSMDPEVAEWVRAHVESCVVCGEAARILERSSGESFDETKPREYHVRSAPEKASIWGLLGRTIFHPAAAAAYVATQGTVDFAPGDSANSVDIQIIDDTFAETEESFEVQITNATNAAEGSTLQIDILDNDTNAGIVQFAKAVYAATEGDREENNLDEDRHGNAVVTLIRTRGSTGALDVDFAYSAATATDGVDHTAPWGIVTFADGETTKRITIPITDDQQVEGTEMIHMMLAAPGGGSGGIGARDTAVLDIIDDEIASAGEVNICQDSEHSAAFPGVNSIPVGEEASWGKDIHFDLTGGTGETVSVELADSGTATPAVDYESIDSSIVFEGDGSETMEFVPIDDELQEGAEIVELSLANPTNGALLGRSSRAFVIIRDDEPNPGVLSVSSEPSCREQGGLCQVYVSRLNGSTGTVTVDYGTMNGEPGFDPAVAGIHYTAASGTLVFDDGEDSQVISIPIIDDQTIGPPVRTFRLFLANPSGGAVVDPESAFVEAKIRDNDDLPFCSLLVAARGSYLEPHIEAMRLFRDNVLMTNALGRAFVDLHYRMSPSVASVLATHAGLRWFARILLTSVVYGVAYPIQAVLILAMATVSVLILRRRRRWRPAMSITLSILLLSFASSISSAAQASDCARSLGVDVEFDGSSGTVNVATLTWISDAVVRGEVLEVGAAEDGSFAAGIHVLTFLKGFENAAEIVVVLGNRPPAFVPGDEVVLFLTTEDGVISLPPLTYAPVVQGRHVVLGRESRYPKSNHLVDEVELVVEQQASGCAGTTGESARSLRRGPGGLTRALGWMSGTPFDMEGAARALPGHYRKHMPEVQAILREHPALLVQVGRAATEIRAEMVAREVDQGESCYVLDEDTIERCRSIAESLREHASPDLQAVLDETMVILEENEGKTLTGLVSGMTTRQRSLHERRSKGSRR